MKKVLIITYFWPPAGGACVQRVQKFAKYLPQFGWQPIILTVKDGEYAAYDESLIKDIPPECRVYRTSSIEPFKLYKKFTGMAKNEAIPVATLTEGKKGWKKKLAHYIRLNLFIPDAKIGWIPFAVKEGKKIIQLEKPDIIFSSSPPPTVHLIARKLAKWSKLKWVADFRDPWTEAYWLANAPRSLLTKKIDTWLEKSVLKHANKVSSINAELLSLYQNKCNNDYFILQNGFEEIENTFESTDKFILMHLGNVTKPQNPETLFKAIDALPENVRTKVELQFVGNVLPAFDKYFKKYSYLNIKKISFMPYKEVIKHAQKASILVKLNAVTEYSNGAIGAKFYDYLSLRRPILALGKKGCILEGILEETRSGSLFEYGDSENVSGFIQTKYDNWKLDKAVLLDDNLELEKYKTKSNVEILSKILEKVTDD